MSKARTLLLVVTTSMVMSLVVIPLALATEPTDSVGVVDLSQGLWYLRDPATTETTSFYFGNPEDFPILGDWDCDGVDTPGLYRQTDGYVYLRNTNSQGIADIKFYFGDPGDIPLAGDFDSDGCDTVSIYRPSEARIYVMNELGSNDGGLGAADFVFSFGDVGDKPFTADFNNDGRDTVGLHRESTGFVYYRNTLTSGNAHASFFYGDPGDQIVAGDWAQKPSTGPDTVGIFRPSSGKFYLRFTNTQGNAEAQFYYGNNSTVAVAGTFGDLPGGDPPPPTTVGKALVTHIVDGDTFDVALNGGTERVRIIGIDTPEVGQCYYQQAKDHLMSLIAGKTVTLTKDVSETDRFGRLLRYVTAPLSNPNGVVDVNLSLLTGGFAVASEYPPDTARAAEFAVTEKVAREAGRGLWGDCVNPTPTM
jgi:endonuclease YncB( thermonuclease family)